MLYGILRISCCMILVTYGTGQAQDTILTRQFQLNYPVSSVAVGADGSVVIASARGRETWNGQSFEVTDPFDFDGVATWEGSILTHEEFFLQSGRFPGQHFQHWAPWVPRGNPMQITAGHDADGLFWVCDGKRLYNFQVDTKQSALIPACSVRGIATIGDSWVAATYSGIFFDGQRICPQVEFSDGNIIARGDSILVFGFNWVVINPNDALACEVFRSGVALEPNGEAVTWQAGADWGNHLMIGNNQGLGEWIDGEFSYVHEGIDVRHLVPTDEGLFVLTADEGIHVWDGTKLRFTGLDLPCSGMAKWTKNRWALATEQGLGIWSPDTGTLDFLTSKDGLTSHSICAVYVDSEECIWFSSFSGILRYSEPHGVLEIHHADVEFNRGSFALGSDSTLYFGSVEGIFTVHPKPLNSKQVRSPWMAWSLFGTLSVALVWIGWLIRKVQLRQNALKAEKERHQREAFLLRLESLVLESLPQSSAITISDKLGMSERQFYRHAAELDIKPGQVIREVKLRRARSLLESNPADLKEVAEAVGYSANYLRRLLKD